MIWNWQQPDWPQFTWETGRLALAEQELLLGGGRLAGTVEQLSGDEHNLFTVEVMRREAITTSELAGEVMDRASVESSIRKQLRLSADKRRVGLTEQGAAEMMVDLYRSFNDPLTEETLAAWHLMLMAGRRDLAETARYRPREEPMQIVSGAPDNPRVHFEAPPSSRVPAEMTQFIEWFNRTAPGAANPLPALTRAGIGHLYFECIHPFADGNGRIGRAIAEKSLAQGLGRPMATALAATILVHRKSYYAAFEAASRRNEITNWLAWFAGMTIEAQRRTLALAEFLIGKAKLLGPLRGQINTRQAKALARMFKEGPEGFAGGMTAGNYATITGASPATTTRDLVDLVDKGGLVREGELRHARYHLNMPLRAIKPVKVNERGELAEG